MMEGRKRIKTKYRNDKKIRKKRRVPTYNWKNVPTYN